MSNTKKRTNRKVRRDRRVRISGVRRNPPDIRKLAAAVIHFAEAQAEADAEAEHARRQAARQRRAQRQAAQDDSDQSTGGST
jgi:hypothetical protein